MLSRRHRLIQATKTLVKEVDELSTHANLPVGAQKEAITPLLQHLKRIESSKKFTRPPPLFDDTENFPIEDMYVELVVAKSLEMAGPLRRTRDLSLAEEYEARHINSRAQHVSVEQCIDNTQHNTFVILGDPGSGKTSLLKYLCLQIARGNNERWLLPIFISLRQYWLNKEKQPSLTLTYYAAATILDQTDSDELSEAQDYQIKTIEKLLNEVSTPDHTQVLFLLDGLNELHQTKLQLRRSHKK